MGHGRGLVRAPAAAPPQPEEDKAKPADSGVGGRADASEQAPAPAEVPSECNFMKTWPASGLNRGSVNLHSIVVYDDNLASGTHSDVDHNLPSNIFGQLFSLRRATAIETDRIFQLETVNNFEMVGGLGFSLSSLLTETRPRAHIACPSRAGVNSGMGPAGSLRKPTGPVPALRVRLVEKPAARNVAPGLPKLAHARNPAEVQQLQKGPAFARGHFPYRPFAPPWTAPGSVCLCRCHLCLRLSGRQFRCQSFWAHRTAAVGAARSRCPRRGASSRGTAAPLVTQATPAMGRDCR